MRSNEHSGSLGRWGIVVLYVLLCGLYFSPIAAPYKIVYPLVLLTISSLGAREPLLTLALAFSALGDLCGAEGELLLQMGAFAAAQVCYLVLFARRITRPSSSRLVLAMLVPTLLLESAFVAIIPAIEDSVVAIGAVVYALLIGAMVTLAGLSKGVAAWIGATLFVLSDFALAYSLFVAPNATLLHLSLVPYFAAQILLWLGLGKR